MIHTYREKNEKKNKRKLARSLSIKPQQDQESSKVATATEGFKIRSMKEIEPSRLKSACRRRTVIDTKAKIVAPIFGERKINMF
jgi:hypothetical protein